MWMCTYVFYVLRYMCTYACVGPELTCAIAVFHAINMSKCDDVRVCGCVLMHLCLDVYVYLHMCSPELTCAIPVFHSVCRLLRWISKPRLLHPPSQAVSRSSPPPVNSRLLHPPSQRVISSLFDVSFLLYPPSQAVSRSSPLFSILFFFLHPK
jgi:hypothetical protein